MIPQRSPKPAWSWSWAGIPVIACLILAALVVARFPMVGLPTPVRRTVVLEGRIVTPQTLIERGWVIVVDGRISRVTSHRPALPDTTLELDTGGLIFPGLIDLHNHIAQNVLPRWHPPQTYRNRDEWRASEEFQHVVAPYRRLAQGTLMTRSHNRCAMNAFGEIRALVGGTTSMLAAQTEAPCIGGMVRNLDARSGFYAWPESDGDHIRNDVFPDAALVPAAERFLAVTDFEAWIVHAAEGSRGDPASLAEFNLLRENGLLTPKTVIVHGTALGRDQFVEMAAAGSSLVWSPRSNLVLYGETTDIRAARELGVAMALGPDWALTGSSNMLDELACAWEWNLSQGLGMTAVELTNMVTVIPASIAGISEQVGRVEEGLLADLLVIDAHGRGPHQSLLEARPRDVRLVMAAGVPIYGAPDLMRSYWGDASLASIQVDGVSRMIVSAPTGLSVPDLRSDLQRWLDPTPLAPLTEDRTAIPSCGGEAG